MQDIIFLAVSTRTPLYFLFYNYILYFLAVSTRTSILEYIYQIKSSLTIEKQISVNRNTESIQSEVTQNTSVTVTAQTTSPFIVSYFLDITMTSRFPYIYIYIYIYIYKQHTTLIIIIMLMIKMA